MHSGNQPVSNLSVTFHRLNRIVFNRPVSRKSNKRLTSRQSGFARTGLTLYVASRGYSMRGSLNLRFKLHSDLQQSASDQNRLSWMNEVQNVRLWKSLRPSSLMASMCCWDP